jgi:signal transduction histidine kinase
VSYRLKMAAWYALSMLLLVVGLMASAHHHLDEELRKDRWDRSHPKFAEWVIHGSFTNEEVGDILGELLQVWLWIGVPLVLGSVGIGYFIAVQAGGPIRRLNQQLAALDSKTLARGVDFPGKDRDLALLVAHINELLQRVAHSYNEMAEFSARIAHELRTPLTLLRMRLESAAPDLPAEFSEEMQEEIRRLTQLVERSLLAAKAERGKLEAHSETVDVSGLLEDLREGYELLAAERSIGIEWQSETGLTCHSDPELLRQILHNLVSNALRHGKDKVRLRAWRGRFKPKVVICVTNVSANDSGATAGTGMGLRLVRSLAGILSGTQFRSRQLGKKLFSVRLSLGR